MRITASGDLVEVLQDSRLLDATQLEELHGALLSRFPDPKDLARELLGRGWLTAYQINQIFQKNGQELVLGQYVLLEKLGEGGMGQVFKARHRRMHRPVALKVIRPEHTANPRSLQRFDREIKAAAQLSHPNVVIAHDAGQEGDTHYFVMEYLEGNDLSKVVRASGPLPIARACDAIRQAALGLQHAHERGLVHRDIKPSNLFVTADGNAVKVLDMGLARLRQAGDDETALTQEGAVMGTPDFMAPEQATAAHEVDIRADLYSLGCTLYYLLTGKVPFPGGSMFDKLAKHRWQDPEPLEKYRPDTPPAVAAVVRRLMAKAPEDRYATPGDLAAALAPFCTAELLSATGPVPATLDWEPSNAASGPAPTAAPRRGAETMPGAETLSNLPPPATGVAPPVSAPGSRSAGPSDSQLFPPDKSGEDVNFRYFTRESVPMPERAEDKAAPLPQEPRPQGKPKRGLVPVLLLLGVGLIAGAAWAVVYGFAVPGLVPATGGDGERQASAGDTPKEATAQSQPKGEGAVKKEPEQGRTEPAKGPEGQPERPGEAAKKAMDQVKEGNKPAEVMPKNDAGQPKVEGTPKKSPDVSESQVPPGPATGVLCQWVVDGVGGPRQVAIAPDGLRGAISHENELRVYDLEVFNPNQSPKSWWNEHWTKVKAKPDYECLALAPQDRRILFGATVDVEFERKDPIAVAAVGLYDGIDPRRRAKIGQGHTQPVTTVAFVPGREMVLSGSADGTARLWELSGVSLKLLRTFKHAKPPSMQVVRCVAASPDGKFGLSGGRDGIVQVWDLDKGSSVAGCKEKSGVYVTAVCVSWDGDSILSGHFDGTIHLWNRADGRPVRSFKGHQREVLAVAFSQDGSRLLSGGTDGTVRCWDTDSAREAWQAHHDGPVRAVMFDPRNRGHALSGGDDGTIRRWNLKEPPPK
jgi:serine/threonine protein kinase